MENISFVIWMVLYPLACIIASYIGSKERVLNNKEPYSDEVRGFSALVNIVIWFVIGSTLYVK